jgi:hypothetical protein
MGPIKYPGATLGKYIHLHLTTTRQKGILSIKYSEALMITIPYIFLVITNEKAKSLSDTQERY